MFSTNLKNLRKQKGMSQEVLAQQLHVVRQTVSKWEKGLSVPDADMLIKIAELFEVSVADLLGSEKQSERVHSETDGEPSAENMRDIANQLAILNEQIAAKAVRRKRLLKRVLMVILIIVVFNVVVACSGMMFFTHVRTTEDNTATTKDVITYTVDGKQYNFEVEHDDQYNVYGFDGDEFIEENIITEDYNDSREIIKKIQVYAEKHGGKVEVKEVKVENTDVEEE